MNNKPILDKIVYSINIFAFVAIFAFYGYKNYIFEKPYPDDFEEFKKLQAELKGKAKEKKVQFEKMTLNLKSRETRLRFIDFQMDVVVFKDKDIKSIETEKPTILDSIIEITNFFEADEINSVTGKLIFENRIKKEINRIINRPVVKKIYFTRFVIQ